MSRRAAGERGASLLEVMVALVILSTVLMALTGMMWQMGRQSGLSEIAIYRTAALERSAAIAGGVPWDSLATVVGCISDSSGTLAYTRCIDAAANGPNLTALTVVVVPSGFFSSLPETLTVYRDRPRRGSTLYQ